MTTCPVAPCAETFDPEDRELLLDHLYEDHEHTELVNTVMTLLAEADRAKANTECQICGNYGATPGDHPLCDSCEKDVRG